LACRRNGFRTAFFQNFSVSGGISEKSICESGCAAIRASFRLRADVLGRSAAVVCTSFLVAFSVDSDSWHRLDFFSQHVSPKLGVKFAIAQVVSALEEHSQERQPTLYGQSCAAW